MADVFQMSEQMKSMKMFEIRNMAKEAGIRGHTIVKKPKLISLNSCIIAKSKKSPNHRTFLCLARDKKIKSYSLLTNSELKKLLGSEIEEKNRISNP